MRDEELIDHETRDPAEVSRMFDRIAAGYDRLNHIMSLGMDIGWRKRVAEETGRVECRRILDVCCGTGDTAIELARFWAGRAQVDGIDVSAESVRLGRDKVAAKGLTGLVQLADGDALALPFDDGRFDAVTITFGLRNLSRRLEGLKEFRRVARPEGRLVCLEFSHPPNRLIHAPYMFYISRVVPLIARLVRTDVAAYRYLGLTVRAFPTAPELSDLIGQAGWREVSYNHLLFGAVAIHTAQK